MFDNSATRRDVLRAGAAGLAVFGGMSQMMSISFAAEGAPLPIEVLTSNSNLTNTLLGIAKDKKFLDDLGLKPGYTNISDGSKAIPAILTGAGDFCTLSGIGLVFPAVARGGALKIIGGSSLLIQNSIMSAKPDVKSLKDLEGRIVGTGALGALAHQVLVAMMEKNKVDVSKVTFRNVGGSPDIFKAVVAGTVDAGFCAIDVYNQQAKYNVHVLSDGDCWTGLPEYTFQASFTSDKAIAEKREALVRVLAAFAKLYRFIQGPDSKDDFIKSYMAVTGDKDDVQADWGWTFIQKVKPYSTDIALSEERIRYMQDLNVQLAVQDSILPFDKVADNSLARDALKLI
jgi:ABC-type nitrate/sulfonate/bicarbonate transport system substrate-binding protein